MNPRCVWPCGQRDSSNLLTCHAIPGPEWAQFPVEAALPVMSWVSFVPCFRLNGEFDGSHMEDSILHDRFAGVLGYGQV